MSKKLTVSALATVLFMAAGIPAASAGVNLFKDYVQGTSIAKYTRSAGYYDCSNSEYKGAAPTPLIFSARNSREFFYSGMSVLHSIALVAPFDQALYKKVTDALAKSFNIIAMGNENTFIDLVTLRNTAKDQDDYVKQFVAIESPALASGDINYTYLEVPETVGYKSVSDILKAAPEDVRQAAVRLVSDHESTSLVVRFELPNVSAKHAPEHTGRVFLRTPPQGMMEELAKVRRRGLS